jgi:hypothetical protein
MSDPPKASDEKASSRLKASDLSASGEQLAKDILDDVLESSSMFKTKAAKAPSQVAANLPANAMASFPQQRPVAYQMRENFAPIQHQAEYQPPVESQDPGSSNQLNSSPPEQTDKSLIYTLKQTQILLQGSARKCNILMQNENGPCALLALCKAT